MKQIENPKDLQSCIETILEKSSLQPMFTVGGRNRRIHENKN